MIKLSLRQCQVLSGTLLGDGNLRISGAGRNARLRVSHREEDGDYLFWKYQELEPSGLFKSPPFLRKNNGYAIGKLLWSFCSRCDPVLTSYYQLFYPNGKKIVSREILDGLGELGLAVWYQDDGSQYRKGGEVILCTEGFGLEGNRIIRKWFKQSYDLRPRVSSRGRLEFRRVDSQKFLELTRPYMVSCMERKFRKKELVYRG